MPSTGQNVQGSLQREASTLQAAMPAWCPAVSATVHQGEQPLKTECGLNAAIFLETVM